MSELLAILKAKKLALAAARRQSAVKPPIGSSRWRLIKSWRKPTDVNAEQFWHDYGQHFIKSRAGTTDAIYVCTEKTFTKPCAICAAVKSALDTAKRNGDVDMEKLIKESGASARILVNAIQVDGEKPTTPVVLELPPSVFEGILGIVMEWAEGGEDVLDLATGKAFVIERTGTGLNTKYSVQIAAKSAPLPASVMSQITNLDEYVQQESPEMAQRALTAFQTTAGLIAGPVGGSRPAVSAPARPALESMMLDDGAIEGVATTVAEAPPAPPKPAPAPAPKAAAPTPAPAALESSGDDELDALLSDLGA